MTNLSGKFGTLQEQMATQHEEVMEALEATNNKLDALLIAFGSPPPTATVTLADVLAVLQDIHTDTQSMDVKLLKIRNSVGLIPDDSGFSILTLFAGLLGRIGVPTGDATTTVLGRLAAIESGTTATATALGIPTGDATTTALGRLAAIESCICKVAGQIPTDPGTSECESPYTSSATWLLQQTSGGESGSIVLLHIAAFPGPLPTGLEEGDLYGLSSPAGTVSELTPATSWDGWRVYVKSHSATYSDSIVASPRYPTGEWRDLSGSFSRVFSVYHPDDITVYLCGPDGEGGGGGGEPITECTVFESTLVDIQPREGTKSAVDAIVPPGAFTTDNDITFAGFAPYVFGSNIVILNDLIGYSVGLESGALVFIAGVAADGTTISQIIHTGEGGYVFTQHTQRVVFMREVNIGTSDGAFSIELCPPV